MLSEAAVFAVVLEEVVVQEEEDERIGEAWRGTGQPPTGSPKDQPDSTMWDG